MAKSSVVEQFAIAYTGEKPEFAYRTSVAAYDHLDWVRRMVDAGIFAPSDYENPKVVSRTIRTTISKSKWREVPRG